MTVYETLEGEVLVMIGRGHRQRIKNKSRQMKFDGGLSGLKVKVSLS